AGRPMRRPGQRPAAAGRPPACEMATGANRMPRRRGRPVAAGEAALPAAEWICNIGRKRHNPYRTCYGGTASVPAPPWYIRARLKTRQLLLLIAIEEHGNIHRAAESMNMSQPAASKLLKDLEDLIGVQLFERLPRGMQIGRAHV